MESMNVYREKGYLKWYPNLLTTTSEFSSQVGPRQTFSKPSVRIPNWKWIRAPSMRILKLTSNPASHPTQSFATYCPDCSSKSRRNCWTNTTECTVLED